MLSSGSTGCPTVLPRDSSTRWSATRSSICRATLPAVQNRARPSSAGSPLTQWQPWTSSAGSARSTRSWRSLAAARRGSGPSSPSPFQSRGATAAGGPLPGAGPLRNRCALLYPDREIFSDPSAVRSRTAALGTQWSLRATARTVAASSGARAYWSFDDLAFSSRRPAVRRVPLPAAVRGRARETDEVLR